MSSSAKYLFFISLLLGISKGFSQLPDFCATDQKVQEAFKRFPELSQNYLRTEKEMQELDVHKFGQGYQAEKNANTIYIIPVVFHIIHENGQENISDAQIKDAVKILNNDFRKLNSDTNLIVPAFQSVAADCQIEFRLAQLDPNGNCTNGIDRIYSSQTNIGDDGSKLNPWPHENYFNVWVVKNISPGGIAGYAYYPGTAPPGAEGVIVLYNYVGSIGTSSSYTSRVLTHETGHYLNLPHVWGSTNSPGVACGDDGVGDTPITKGWTSCNISGNICNPGIVENVQNYMEYSYCTKMFSWGQKARMIAALNSSNGSRNTLWLPANIIATGVDSPSLCAADFSSFPNSSTLCAGEIITFKDLSYNAKPTAWTWSFPGGTLVSPSTIHDSMPQVQYNNAGVYSVSLSVSNSISTVNTTKTAFVTVNAATAQFASPSFVEDFETSQVPGNWNIHDLDGGGNTWQKTTAAQSSGTFSVFINNAVANNGDADELISPSIDFTAIPSPYFTFKYAFAPKFGNAGKLIVYNSPDCGKSWYQRKGITGTALPTASPTFSPFLPNAAEWKQETVNMANVTNQNNVLIKFKYINQDGNNLYLDDINILSALGFADEKSQSFSIQILPNPIDENSQLILKLDKQSKVCIELKNLLGQKVKEIYSGNLNEGKTNFSITKQAELSAGIYFLNLLINGEHFTQKVVVK